MLSRLKHSFLRTPLEAPVRFVEANLIAALRALREPTLAGVYREKAAIDKILLDLLRPESACIDAGAPVGYYLSVFTRRARRGRHIGVEPDAAHAAWLRKKFPGAEIIDGALGVAPAVTLDALTAARESIDIIRFGDAAGALDALAGGRETLARLKPFVLFTAGPVGAGANGSDLGDALYALLTKESGYEIRSVADAFAQEAVLSLDQFRDCRTHPYKALTFLASPR